MATTETGQMVMGSRKGEIRLFSDKTFNRDIDPLARLKPRAKTTLPGLGGMMVAVSLFCIRMHVVSPYALLSFVALYADPIIGIDVTADGRWILATCRNYLLVASTALEKGTTGFEVITALTHQRSLSLSSQLVLSTDSPTVTSPRWARRSLCRAS
jgi:hypothetical protein